nr:MAG TPA: hypothetical protein [Crassvirales sp.]
MTKRKVGAEPKNKVKHSFTKDAGIHEGIHRDEPGWYDGKLHCYCFGYGYFFHRGKPLGTKLTPDYIKENWDKEGWCEGLKGACMAIINRERKIAVIKEGTDYSCSIKYGLPVGYTIYKTDEDIPLYDVTEPKNKKVLIKMHMTYLIKKYLETYYHEYKVLNSGSKQIPNYGSEHRLQYFTEIKNFADKYKFIPKCKPLYTKPYWINDYKVDFPTIKTILEDKLFTDEELLKIKKCKFYTKFCLHKGVSWKELDKNWSDDYIEEVKIKDKAKAEAFDKLAKRYADESEANFKEALAKANSSVDDWRKPNYTSKIKYMRYYANYYKRTIEAIPSFIHKAVFSNTQLRLKPDKPNWVETSRGAIVPLEAAINVFNRLYTDYILSGKTIFRFKRDEFRIGSFCVSSISYEDKFVDLIKCGQDEPEKSGYKEWKFVIGCHILWFDDIKDFARYYNLQNRLAFPLNRTTEECMENHLIHLHS